MRISILNVMAILCVVACSDPEPEGGDDTTSASDTASPEDTRVTDDTTEPRDSGGADTQPAMDTSVPPDTNSDTRVAEDTQVADTGAPPGDTAQPEDTASGGSGFAEGFEGNADLLTGSFGDWQVLHPERAISIDVGNTKPGWLVVIPTELSQNAWFEDNYGPLVYQEVTGNFAVVTHLRVVSKNATDQPPSKGFNAGGFVFRDASGTHSGNENWVMFNMGGQGGPDFNYGREIKKTVGSNSDLYINPQTGLDRYLKACRVGDRFTFYTWNGAAWDEEQFHNNAQVDGQTVDTHRPAGTEITPELNLPASGSSTTLFFDHAGMPTTLQLGVMGHTWAGAADTRAEFDYIHLADTPPTSASECVSAFPDPTAL